MYQFDNECDFLTRHFYNIAYRVAYDESHAPSPKETRIYRLCDDEGKELVCPQIRKRSFVRTLNSLVVPAIIVKVNEW